MALMEQQAQGRTPGPALTLVEGAADRAMLDAALAGLSEHRRSLVTRQARAATEAAAEQAAHAKRRAARKTASAKAAALAEGAAHEPTNPAEAAGSTDATEAAAASPPPDAYTTAYTSDPLWRLYNEDLESLRASGRVRVRMLRVLQKAKVVGEDGHGEGEGERKQAEAQTLTPAQDAAQPEGARRRPTRKRKAPERYGSWMGHKDFARAMEAWREGEMEAVVADLGPQFPNEEFKEALQRQALAQDEATRALQAYRIACVWTRVNAEHVLEAQTEEEEEGEEGEEGGEGGEGGEGEEGGAAEEKDEVAEAAGSGGTPPTTDEEIHDDEDDDDEDVAGEGDGEGEGSGVSDEPEVAVTVPDGADTIRGQGVVQSATNAALGEAEVVDVRPEDMKDDISDDADVPVLKAPQKDRDLAREYQVEGGWTGAGVGAGVGDGVEPQAEFRCPEAPFIDRDEGTNVFLSNPVENAITHLLATIRDGAQDLRSLYARVKTLILTEDVQTLFLYSQDGRVPRVCEWLAAAATAPDLEGALALLGAVDPDQLSPSDGTALATLASSLGNTVRPWLKNLVAAAQRTAGKAMSAARLLLGKPVVQTEAGVRAAAQGLKCAHIRAVRTVGLVDEPIATFQRRMLDSVGGTPVMTRDDTAQDILEASHSDLVTDDNAFFFKEDTGVNDRDDEDAGGAASASGFDGDGGDGGDGAGVSESKEAPPGEDPTFGIFDDNEDDEEDGVGAGGSEAADDGLYVQEDEEGPQGPEDPEGPDPDSDMLWLVPSSNRREEEDSAGAPVLRARKQLKKRRALATLLEAVVAAGELTPEDAKALKKLGANSHKLSEVVGRFKRAAKKTPWTPKELAQMQAQVEDAKRRVAKAAQRVREAEGDPVAKAVAERRATSVAVQKAQRAAAAVKGAERAEGALRVRHPQAAKELEAAEWGKVAAAAAAGVGPEFQPTLQAARAARDGAAHARAALDGRRLDLLVGVMARAKDRASQLVEAVDTECGRLRDRVVAIADKRAGFGRADAKARRHNQAARDELHKERKQWVLREQQAPHTDKEKEDERRRIRTTQKRITDSELERRQRKVDFEHAVAVKERQDLKVAATLLADAVDMEKQLGALTGQLGGEPEPRVQAEVVAAGAALTALSKARGRLEGVELLENAPDVVAAARKLGMQRAAASHKQDMQRIDAEARGALGDGTEALDRAAAAMTALPPGAQEALHAMDMQDAALLAAEALAAAHPQPSAAIQEGKAALLAARAAVRKAKK